MAGTINTILLINQPVSPSALARLVVTMTEGKSAALQRLAVPSCYSHQPGRQRDERHVGVARVAAHRPAYQRMGALGEGC